MPSSHCIQTKALPGHFPAHNTRVPALIRDGHNGAFLTGDTANALTLREPRLRCLDIADCPQLARLDLTGCRADLHLTVRGCPKLRSVNVPETTAHGAIVHIDFGDEPTPLHVAGDLQTLDACWADGHLATKSRKKRFRNAYLGPWIGPSVWADYGLVVLFGTTTLPDALHIGADKTVRELQALDTADLVSITADCPLAALSVSRAPRLGEVSLNAGVGCLRVTDAPALARVTGPGRNAVLSARSGALAGLMFSDAWSHLRLTESGIERLEARHLKALELINCDALRRLHLQADTSTSVVGATQVVGLGLERLRLDASALRHLAFAAHQGDTEAGQLLGAWCAEATHPRGWLDALVVLAELADLDFDPAWLWSLRCRLHARCNRAAGNGEHAADSAALAINRWHWNLPHDLAQRGWDADLALWQVCRHLPQARSFQYLLARTSQPRHLATMARYLLTHDACDAGTEPLYACLNQALRNARPQPRIRGPHGVRRQAPPEVAHERYLAGDYLESVLQCAVARRDRALADALAHYVGIMLPPEPQIPLLARLLRLGVTDARQPLMQLATRLRVAQAPEPAADALAAAMAPVNQPLFAPA